MSSLKQAIVNAIMEVTSNPAYASGKNYESAEAARDDFVKQLLAVLFPENPGTEMPPVVEEKVKVKKPRAKKAAKATEAAPAVEEAAPVAEAVAPAVEEAVAPAVEAAPVAEKEKVKKPRAKKAKAEAPAEGSNAAAPAPEKEKKPRKPKDTDGAVKLTATQVTKAKEIAKTVGVEFDKKAFLAWMGQLTEEERREPLETMVRAYLSPAASSAPAAPVNDVYKELEMTAVMFEGEEYWVHAESGAVYKTEDNVDKKVGMVGQAKFEHMVVPAE
jgi:hypothetical protein